ncbi:MAG: hypothetical protein ACRD1L_11700 [Terriglobales bacterium]
MAWPFRRRCSERDLEDELQFHLEHAAAKTGSLHDAAALLGGGEAIKEECREQWAWARLAGC